MPKFLERPVPKVKDFTGAAGICEFYRHLGWNENLEIDESKVAIHPDDYASICLELALAKDPEHRVLALGMWLFRGPKPDKEVPRSKIRLYPGCFREKHTA